MNISDEYLEWLIDIVCRGRFSKEITYRKLLCKLYDIPFRYFIGRDSNRAEDGLDLRYRFSYVNRYEDRARWIDDRPCSVLEMMIALAIRCEESIMDDPQLGDRTGQWFWGMITNIGLGSMTDDRFDSEYVEEKIDCFLNREYEPNGKGGLFTVKNRDCDMRKVEIWYQLCYFLDTIT